MKRTESKAAELARQLLETIKAEQSNPDEPDFDDDALRERAKRDAEEMRRARNR